MTKESEQSGHFCFRCNKDIPLLHSSWEGVNSTSKLHWFVNYCPKCGTVTNIEQTTFHYSNLVPRIGRIKSFLFILLVGTPHQLVAWLIGGLGPGIGLSTLVLLLACLFSRSKIYQVESCPYTRWGQYPELVREGLNDQSSL